MMTMKDITTRSPSRMPGRSLYGASVEILGASNESLVAVKGLVIKETRNLLVLRTDNQEEKKIEKKNCLLRIRLKDADPVVIHGRHLVGRFDERVKRYARKK